MRKAHITGNSQKAKMTFYFAPNFKCQINFEQKLQIIKENLNMIYAKVPSIKMVSHKLNKRCPI